MCVVCTCPVVTERVIFAKVNMKHGTGWCCTAMSCSQRTFCLTTKQIGARGEGISSALAFFPSRLCRTPTGLSLSAHLCCQERALLPVPRSCSPVQKQRTVVMAFKRPLAESNQTDVGRHVKRARTGKAQPAGEQNVMEWSAQPPSATTTEPQNMPYHCSSDALAYLKSLGLPRACNIDAAGLPPAAW